jgi:hypothetical protein
MKEKKINFTGNLQEQRSVWEGVKGERKGIK